VQGVTLSDDVEHPDLERIPLFAGLSDEDLARIAGETRRLHWDSGHVAVQEGEFAFDFYVIERGAAEVQQGGQRIRALGPGDCFGELGVTRPREGRWSRRRTASVLVTEPTDALAIDGAAIRRLADEVPQLGAALRAAGAAHRDA